MPFIGDRSIMSPPSQTAVPCDIVATAPHADEEIPLPRHPDGL